MALDFDLDAASLADEDFYARLGRVREARIRFLLRGTLALVGCALSAYFISLSWTEIGFYSKSGQEPIDLGDLRSESFEPSVLETLGTNDYVRFSNDLVSLDELESDDFNFYYSPLTNFVVRTGRELPNKDYYKVRDPLIEISPAELELLTSKKAFVWDLKVSFDGVGRIVRVKDAPRWAKTVAKFMAASAHIEEARVPEMFVFLDGDAPEDYDKFLWLAGLGGLLALVTLGLFFDAAIRYYLATRRARTGSGTAERRVI